MRKKAPKRKPNPADALLKTSKKKDIELTEKELGNVTGGRTGKAPVEYLKIKLTDILIS